MATQPVKTTPFAFMSRLPVWQWMVAQHRPTAFVIVLNLIFAIMAFIGLFADPRLIEGQPIWAKTFKFATSIIIYLTTLLWIMSYVQKRRFVRSLLLNTTAIVFVIEALLIITQAIRGQPMHFNYSTVLDGTLYTIMAVSIFILLGVSLIGFAIVLFERLPGHALAWGIRLGLMSTLIFGYVEGTLMTAPTPIQMAEMKAESADSALKIGAHTVGAKDGGAGIPLLGWSSTDGDLRVGHFFGLHSLQVMPLLGVLIDRRQQWQRNQKIGLVVLGAAIYAGWTVLVTWQALRGQSIVQPDSITRFAIAGLFLVGSGLMFLILKVGAVEQR